MSGHLFIVQGDLTRLACDAWLLPTSRALWVEEHWLRTAPEGLKNQAVKLGPDYFDDDPERVVRVFQGVVEPPHGWHEKRVRTFDFVDWTTTEHQPTPWLTRMAFDSCADPETKATWFAEGARQFVVEAAKASAEAVNVCAQQHSHAPRRLKPLLAVPVVGTGQSGGSNEAGIILRKLLQTLLAVLRDVNVDVVLVAHRADQLAGAQHARRQIERSSAAPDLWTGLSDGLKSVGSKLAARSVSGDLVLFLGAGVSVSAGLPTWTQLLNGLADDGQFDESAKEALQSLPLVDQAHLIRNRLERPDDPTAEPVSLAEAIRAHVRADHYGMQHALLANLPVRETATTNYDTLFETASVAAHHKVAVLPYEAVTGSDRWLLKLHGCVAHGDEKDIVLTREDYLRYADRRGALAGIVQALLVTRHMLFVGFSLTDDNFHRIVDEVRKVRPATDVGTRAVPAREFGTALLLEPSPLLAQLWRDEIDCVTVGGDSTSTVVNGVDEMIVRRLDAANRLEILLDFVSSEANRSVSHLLDDRYQGLLTKAEEDLRDRVRRLARDVSPEVQALPAWRLVADLLGKLGHGSPE
jgi:hypothetical protein